MGASCTRSQRSRYADRSLLRAALVLSLLLTPWWGAPARAAVVADQATAAHISAVPDAGPPQSTVTIAGSAFAPNAHLTVVYTDAHTHAVPIGDVTAGADGGIAATRVTVPPSAVPGSIGMLVVRADAQHALANALFAVTPLATTLVADPSAAAPGDTVHVVAGGLEPDTPAQFQLLDPGGNEIYRSTQPLTTTDTGSLGPIDLMLPTGAAGTITGTAVLNAIDVAGNVASVPLRYLSPGAADSSVQLTPTTAVLNSQIAIAAGGFAPGEALTVTLIGPSGLSTTVQGFQATAGGAFGAPLAADSSGMVRGSFTIPQTGDVVLPDAPGTVAGDGGSLLIVSLRGAQSGLTRGAPLVIGAPHILTIPSTVVAGHAYTILGSGFAAGEPVAIGAIDARGGSRALARATASTCAIAPPQPARPAVQGAAPRCAAGTFTVSAVAPRDAPPVVAQTTAGGAAPSGAGYRLSATGQTSGLIAHARLLTASAPTLALQRYVVAPGQSVLVQGSAFQPSTTITLQVGFAAGAGTGCATRGTTCVVTELTGTDESGSFRVTLTVPLTAQIGPIAVQAQDRQGDAASVVLTVYRGIPNVSVLPAARPGQVIGVSGSGFASGETVEIYLAIPAGAGAGSGTGAPAVPAALPNSTITASADAFGSLLASYPLPQPFIDGSYYVVALGETSGQHAFSAIAIGEPPVRVPTVTPCARGGCTPSPSPTPAGTPTPPPCSLGQGDAPRHGCTADTVSYFADGSTAQITASVLADAGGGIAPCPSNQSAGATPCATARVSFREELHLQNQADQPATIDVLYLVYGVGAVEIGPPAGVRIAASTSTNAAHGGDDWRVPAGGGALELQRRQTFTIGAHATMLRSVNGDIGNGHLVSIIMRAAGTVIATTVTHRLLTIAGSPGCPRQRPCTRILDAAGSAGAGPHGTASAPSQRWAFPEGYHGGQFEEYLSLLNPQTGPTTVDVRFLTPTGPLPGIARISLPPFGRGDLDVQQAIARLCGTTPAGRPGAGRCSAAPGAVGIALVGTSPVVVERSLYWGPGIGPLRAGYDVAAGLAGTDAGARTAQFALASSLPGNRAFLSVLDDGARPAVVTVTAYSDAGIRLAQRRFVVAAGSHTGIGLDRITYPGVYALTVVASTPIACEVAQYFGGSSDSEALIGFVEPAVEPVLYGGIDGFPAAATGEPARANRVTLRVFNPGDARAMVRVALSTPDGARPVGQYQVGPHATLRVSVQIPRQLLAGIAPQPIGLSVSCTHPCLAMAFTGGPGAQEAWSSAAR